MPATANPAGTWSAHGLDPGTYLIQVGNELDPSWRMERIEVGSDDEILDFLLDAVAVRGELTLAGEPVIGTLWFGGRHGEESIRFDTGEEGEFRGYLPREGDWRVELSRPGWFGVQNVPPVTVERSSGQSVARVRIELPDTTLRGRVIDADGQPKPGARLLAVDVQKASRELTEVADEEGRFEFRGLDEATLSMRAESPEGSSDWIPVRIEEGQEGPEVVLRIAERRTIRGRVVSPSGPVADATVVLTPVSTGQAPVAVIEENTRVDGTFEVQVPHHVRVLSVLVLPPGFAAKVFLHSLSRGPGSGSGGESMDIQVSGQGGTLGLVPASSPKGARTSGLILHDGAVIGLDDLGRWARLQGERPAADGRIRIPRIESGWYRLCRVSSPSPAEDQGAPRCDEGFLPEGGELTLSVETRQEAKR